MSLYDVVVDYSWSGYIKKIVYITHFFFSIKRSFYRLCIEISKRSIKGIDQFILDRILL
jgi:hypothetical protein